METKILRKRFDDLMTAKLTTSVIRSRRENEEMLKKLFGDNIVRYDISYEEVEVASSKEYGRFIDKLKVGTKVVMTGAEVEIFPEYKGKVWEVEHEPQMMGGEMVVWLNGFSGAYSCLLLKLAEEL